MLIINDVFPLLCNASVDNFVAKTCAEDLMITFANSALSLFYIYDIFRKKSKAIPVTGRGGL
jgi:hypothetical protein